MAFWNWIGGVLKPAKDLAEVFVENKEERAERRHEETIADSELNAAVLQQFATEFQRRASRSWWDSFVDGLNRLPRPLLTLSVMAFFLLTPFYPEKIIEVSMAYEVIPAGFWALLSIIVGFYFGGRMQLKSQDFSVKGSAVKAAQDLVQVRREFREVVTGDDPREEQVYRRAVATQGRKPNQTARQWRAQARPAAPDPAAGGGGAAGGGDASPMAPNESFR